MVPEEWKSTHLVELIEGQIKNGYSPNATDYITGYWVLGLGALSENGFNCEVIKSVEPTEKVLSNLLACDDFLVSRSNTPDKVGLAVRYKGELLNCSYPDLMMRFRIDPKKADLDYIEQKIRSSSIRNYYKSCAAGSSSTMVKINKSVVEKTTIQLPPLTEQKKIAKILSTWDRAIEVTEKLLSNSQQQKKSLMQQLITGKKRLLGFSGEWDKKALSKIANIVMGSSPKSESYNKLKKGLPLLQGNADIKNRLSAPRVYTSQITKECLEGDILLSVRAPVGEVSHSVHHACIGRGIAAIRAKNNMSQNYIYQWLLHFEPKWVRLSQGSTFEAVNSNDIKTLHIDIPQKEEQQKIASVLSTADKEIETFQQKLECLRQEKKALMQQLLTGKRRVVV